eukprot:844601-Amphidinium_carterae.1
MIFLCRVQQCELISSAAMVSAPECCGRPHYHDFPVLMLGSIIKGYSQLIPPEALDSKTVLLAKA